MLKNNTITLFILLTFILLSCNPVVGAPTVEPDWNKIDYGIIEHENMPLYGEPFVINYNEVMYTGTNEVHTLTKEQWKEIWSRIIKWKDSHGGIWPNYVDISKYHVNVDKIDYETYNKMHTHWEQWKKGHNGQEPQIIGIKDKTDSTVNSQSSNRESIQKKLIDAVGTFKSFTEFYNLCKSRGYKFYKNNKYSRDVAIQRLKSKHGLNCVDVSQLGYALAKEIGYDVKFQESYCPKDRIGHVLLKVKGHELGDNWVIVDLAACISTTSKAALGYHWCGTPHDAHTNWVE